MLGDWGFVKVRVLGLDALLDGIYKALEDVAAGGGWGRHCDGGSELVRAENKGRARSCMLRSMCAQCIARSECMG